MLVDLRRVRGIGVGTRRDFEPRDSAIAQSSSHLGIIVGTRGDSEWRAFHVLEVVVRAYRDADCRSSRRSLWEPAEISRQLRMTARGDFDALQREEVDDQIDRIWGVRHAYVGLDLSACRRGLARITRSRGQDSDFGPRPDDHCGAPLDSEANWIPRGLSRISIGKGDSTTPRRTEVSGASIRRDLD